MEIGEFGVAHVWFQYYGKQYFENAQNTTLDTNYNPNPAPAPTRMNFVSKKRGVFLFFSFPTGRPH